MMKDKWLKVISCSSRKRIVCCNPVHTHGGYELFYNISGTSHLIVQEDAGTIKTYDLMPGQFIFIGGSRPHHLNIHENDNCYMILLNLELCEAEEVSSFSLSWLNGICQEAAGLFSAPNLFIYGKDYLNSLCGQLTLLVQSVLYCRRDAILGNTIHLLLASALVEIAYLRMLAHSEKGSYQSHYVNVAIGFIEQHYHDPFKIEDAASQVGIHPAYLQRIFHEKTGSTIIEYTTALRINNGKMLLENTNYSIMDVVLECGFFSRQHFSRSFKRLTGMTPAQYRRKYNRNREKSIYVLTEVQKEKRT